MLWKANGSGMCRSTSRNRRRDPSHSAWADERVVAGCAVWGGRHGIVGRTGPYMSVTGTVGGGFGPGDDVGRAWDEAEAILLACDDLDAVMETIHGAETPVEARRALK